MVNASGDWVYGALLLCRPVPLLKVLVVRWESGWEGCQGWGALHIGGLSMGHPFGGVDGG